jgi:hypothetical protein
VQKSLPISHKSLGNVDEIKAFCAGTHLAENDYTCDDNSGLHNYDGNALSENYSSVLTNIQGEDRPKNKPGIPNKITQIF